MQVISGRGQKVEESGIIRRRLVDVVMNYTRNVNIKDDSKVLQKTLKQCLCKEVEPVSVGSQLPYVRQQDNETLG